MPKGTNYNKCLVCQKRAKTQGQSTCEPCAYRMTHKDEILGDVLAPNIIAGITRNLSDFGYNIGESDVLAEVELIAVGKPVTSIIGRFARNMLVEAKLVK